MTGPSGRKYHHNGDFSGDVIACVSPGDVTQEHDPEVGDFSAVSIPAEDILAVAAEFVRSKRIEQLESADPISILLRAENVTAE